MAFGCGIGIRTPTNRVRVCRATVTQFRNTSERMILYQILFFLSILFYDFVKKFHFGAALQKCRHISACRRTALFARRKSFTSAGAKGRAHSAPVTAFTSRAAAVRSRLFQGATPAPAKSRFHRQSPSAFSLCRISSSLF